MLLLAAFFALGAIIGGQVNHAIYRFAFFDHPPYSPWMKPHPDVGPRNFLDYLPIVGWCFLNREEKVHGSLFWLRPFLIEVGFGFAVAGLYYLHLEGQGLGKLNTEIPIATRWAWFAAHTVMLTLLAVATFIDFDEFMIPDQVTIPGVLFFTIFAAIFPGATLPTEIQNSNLVEPMTFASPKAPPVFWFGNVGLICSVACLWFWCFALIPKVCTFRKGLGKFLPLMIASILQRPRRTNGNIKIAPRKMYWGTPVLVAIAIVGTVAIPLFWWFTGDDQQKLGLLTSLLGMAFGMGMIWSIRVIGRLALGKEAMGFGDVTLMAMIGAYVGWQACLPILAASALLALLVSVPMAFLKSDTVLPYGPYLSLGTVLVILFWNQTWEFGMKGYFSTLEPQFIFYILVGMTIPMFILLLVTRFVKERLIGIE